MALLPTPARFGRASSPVMRRSWSSMATSPPPLLPTAAERGAAHAVVRRRRENEIMTSIRDAARLLPYTGKEFLDSLDDGREVWIYGERVSNIAEHPAFRNTARMVARLYDALHRDHTEAKNQL